MICFGLIGKQLTHSFSSNYFAEKFKILGLEDRYEYKLYPIGKIEELIELLNTNKKLKGLNITIPYKKEVLEYCTWMSPEVIETGAANTLMITRDYEGNVRGIDAYNTDVTGFNESLLGFIKKTKELKAIVLGNGGGAAAVQYALAKNKIPFVVVARDPSALGTIAYKDLDHDILASHKLIINTTPVGMYPDINNSPEIPYEALTSSHFLFDLVYNPDQTEFLKKGAEMGAKIKNGLEMLHLQADKAWELWNA